MEEGNQMLFEANYRRGDQFENAVLRVYFNWVERPDVEAEANWLHAIATDTDLLVPFPIPAVDGSFVQDLAHEPDSEAGVAVLQAWVPGVKMAENATPDRSPRASSCTRTAMLLVATSRSSSCR